MTSQNVTATQALKFGSKLILMMMQVLKWTVIQQFQLGINQFCDQIIIQIVLFHNLLGTLYSLLFLECSSSSK